MTEPSSASLQVGISPQAELGQAGKAKADLRLEVDNRRGTAFSSDLEQAMEQQVPRKAADDVTQEKPAPSDRATSGPEASSLPWVSGRLPAPTEPVAIGSEASGKRVVAAAAISAPEQEPVVEETASLTAELVNKPVGDAILPDSLEPISSVAPEQAVVNDDARPVELPATPLMSASLVQGAQKPDNASYASPVSSDARGQLPVTDGPAIARHSTTATQNPATRAVSADLMVLESAVLDEKPAVKVVSLPVQQDEIMSQSALASRYRQFASDGLNGVPIRRLSNEGDASALPLDTVPVLSQGAGEVLSTRPLPTTSTLPSTLPSTSTPTLPLPSTVAVSGRMDGVLTTAPQVDNELAAAMNSENGVPVVRSADLLKEIQAQRSALPDAILSAANGPTTDVTARSQSVDNMFTALSGGTVTAPVIQRADAASSVATQAPFNVSLMEGDAEDADAMMGANIRWMAKEGIQNATVTVTPAGMGPISVKVGIDQDQMSVSIMASQQSTREALESFLPRLREQLGGQGHESVKLDVSDGRGEQSRSGNGQMFSGSDNPSGSWSQGSQSNAVNRDREQESESMTETERQVAEDLQHVGKRAGNGQFQSSAFDAYV